MKHERLHNHSALSDLARLVEDLKKNEDRINAALKYSGGTHVFDDIVHMIMSGRITFIPLENSFVILEVIQHPQTNLLNVFLAGGDLDEVCGFIPDMEAIAVQNKCSHLTMTGRKGWLKPLCKDRGWEETGVSLKFKVRNNKVN